MLTHRLFASLTLVTSIGCSHSGPPSTESTTAASVDRATANGTPSDQPFCSFAEPDVPASHDAATPTPDAADAYARGLTASESGELERAREAYAEALRLDPTYSDAAYNLGVTFARLDREEEAIAAFERCFASDPTSADSLYNLGLLHYLRGEFEAALDAWRRARTITPRAIDVTKKIVQALHALGRFDEAETERREVRRIRACSDDPDVRSMTAFVIDQFEVGGEQVVVYEVFDPDPQWTVFYSFRVIANDQVVRAIQLESDPVSRENGVAALFGVAFPDDAHFATRFTYRELPRYADIRSTAIELVRDSVTLRRGS